MNRQHSAPLLLRNGAGGAISLPPLGHGVAGGVSEADIQALVQEHPESLPISEIDPMFADAVPICRELNTPAGAIDNLMITPRGLPVLVECKLWRNPEGRREVVGQILDYAKELSRWSSSDLQREVSIRLKQRSGNPMLDIIRSRYPETDEAEFNDALTVNLRRGRFLLLIVGDGIRAGVEAIAEYLQQHSGLHFSLGLVEMPIYLMPGGSKLVVPRVLAKTHVVTRNVVSLPDGFGIEQSTDIEDDAQVSPETVALGNERQQFWTEFLRHVKLDDPEQTVPPPARGGYLSFMLPAPAGSSWITVYRDRARNEVGLFLSSSRNSPGETAKQRVADDWENVSRELGGTAKLIDHLGTPRIREERRFESLNDPEQRLEAFRWLADRVNTFVNVLRPRVRSAVADRAVAEE